MKSIPITGPPNGNQLLSNMYLQKNKLGGSKTGSPARQNAFLKLNKQKVETSKMGWKSLQSTKNKTQRASVGGDIGNFYHGVVPTHTLLYVCKDGFNFPCFQNTETSSVML